MVLAFLGYMSQDVLFQKEGCEKGLEQGRTGFGSVTSRNSALPSRRRRLCGYCEMWTAVGWGEKRVLDVRAAAI